MGWTLLTLALVAAALYGAWRYALSTNAVALLDGIDVIAGGRSGATLAAHDMPFGPLPAQKLEVYTPAIAGTKRPVLVFFYGGGWRTGSQRDYHFIGRNFAREGYVVVIPGYRLTPDGIFPHMLEDGAKGLAWVRDHVAEYGGDPEQIYLIGHSAGAYNALMLTLDRQWLGREGVPEGFIKGAIGLAGPYDFYPFDSDNSRAAFGAAPRPEATQPVNFARGDAPPMLLLSGTDDTTVKPRNSLALAKAMSAAGVPTQAVLFKGMSHAGIIMTLARPFDRDRRVKDAVLAFLAAQRPASATVQAAAQ